MPVQRGIYILEQPGAHHIDLAAAAFFGRRPVDPNLAFRAGRLEPALDRDGSSDRPAAEQMMPAGVPGDLIGYGLAVRIGGLRHAGQRVHLGEDGDDRTAARASARHERGRNSGDPRLDREPRVVEFVLKQRRGLGLLVSEFRRGPDLERDFRNARRIGVDAADQLRLMVGGKLSRRKRRAGAQRDGGGRYEPRWPLHWIPPYNQSLGRSRNGAAWSGWVTITATGRTGVASA